MDDGRDIIDALAPLLKVRLELQQTCRFGGGGWTAPHLPESGGWAPFHAVTSGACILEVEGQPPVRLDTGDIAVLPHGRRHTIRSVHGRDGTQLRAVPRADGLIFKTNVLEGAQPETQMVCGRLHFDEVSDHVVLAALPGLVTLRAADGPDAGRARRQVDAIREELEQDRLGAAAIAGQLANVLVMTLLRTHLERQEERHDLLALLAHRPTSRVLNALLADPARDWSLDELAEIGITSRATLVRLFRKAVGDPPLTFLTRFRLDLARQHLRTGSEPLAAVAAAVGYANEAAFNRAYQRHHGITPGADRKAEA
jgi:AraC family transcriptional activator of mtrCDE